MRVNVRVGGVVAKLVMVVRTMAMRRVAWLSLVVVVVVAVSNDGAAGVE